MCVLFGCYRATVYDKEEKNNFPAQEYKRVWRRPVTSAHTSPFREEFQNPVLLGLALTHCGHFTEIQEFGLKENWT